MRTTYHFPIYRQQLSLCQLMQFLYPIQKTDLNLLRIQQRIDPPKGIMRWSPIRQSQHPGQPLFPGTPEFFYLDPVVRSADHCAYCYHQNIAQLMKLRPFDSGVFQFRKVLNQ